MRIATVAAYYNIGAGGISLFWCLPHNHLLGGCGLNQMKKIIVILLYTFISGCVTIPVVPNERLSYKLPYQPLTETLISKAHAEWPQPFGWSQDRHIVTTRFYSENTLILDVNRWAPDQVLPRFFSLTVENTGDGVIVYLQQDQNGYDDPTKHFSMAKSWISEFQKSLTDSNQSDTGI